VIINSKTILLSNINDKIYSSFGPDLKYDCNYILLSSLNYLFMILIKFLFLNIMLIINSVK